MKATIISKILFSLGLAFMLAAGANANSPPVAVGDFYGVDQLAALNEAAPGVLVNDSDPDAGNTLTAALLTGPSHARSFQLNSNGSFSYVPAAGYDGPDSFSYHAYDGTLYSDSVTVNITVRQPCSEGGSITGGGRFFQNGRKCTFGFEAKMQGTGVQGNLDFQDQNMNFKVKGGTMASVYAPTLTDGYFNGACSVNNITGYSYFVQVHDHGQPSSNDDFSVWVYDANGAQVYTSGGLLSGGNILIHDSANAVSPSEWFCDNDGDGYTVSAGVSCAAPSSSCSQNPGLGADCDDNNPNITTGVSHWWCDSDEDGYYADYGFSCTAPVGFGSCSDHISGGGIDCNDNDPNITNDGNNCQ